MPMSKWNVETDAARIRRFGKQLEELGELSAVTARCIIQGVDEIDPSSGKTNRQRLEEEMADVLAQLELTVRLFDLNQDFIVRRVGIKHAQMVEWEGFFKEQADEHPDHRHP